MNYRTDFINRNFFIIQLEKEKTHNQSSIRVSTVRVDSFHPSPRVRLLPVDLQLRCVCALRRRLRRLECATSRPPSFQYRKEEIYFFYTLNLHSRALFLIHLFAHIGFDIRDP